jgi:hypothetical protein
MYQIYKNPELSDSFLSQINLIENVEYEFTWQGAFVHFTFSNENYIKVSVGSIDCNRLTLTLKSDELEYECPVDIVIKSDWKIDYIEFNWGFIESKLPEKYVLWEYKPNVIIVDEEY